ncbi:DNA adenine methylase [Limnobaculum sp. M2-1]|nr:DNA adenine methylase [Limnobaculum sp. M2-1]
MRNKLPANRNIGIDLDQQVINLWHGNNEVSCELIQDDAVAYLSLFPYQGNELIYADPPYVQSTRKRSKIYRHEYTDDNHRQLLQLLVTLPCMVMVSGYENSIYDEMLSGWRCERFNAKTHTGVREECVWMNFDVPDRLHDARYMGSNYRERQTLIRRRTRLYERIERMELTERNELIHWLNAKYGLEVV